MPPRPRVKIGNVERRLIAEQYRQHDALWDIIVNGINKNLNLSSYYTTCRPSTIMTVVILCVGEIETTFIVKQGSKYSNQTLIFAKVYINKMPI